MTYTARFGDGDRLLADRIAFAGASGERRRGLLRRPQLDPGDGLWLTPCEAIHTFGMNFPIDAIFLDKHLRVRKITPQLPPKRIAFCLSAYSVLEIEAGGARRANLEIGSILNFTRNVRNAALAPV